MQAVILAGGKGTRLAERLNGRPKPLVDVDGVPLLERQILQLRAFGVNDVVVLVNHAADQIKNFCSERENFGLGALRLIDDGDPRGTAGAVLACLNELKDRFLIIYGDTLFNVAFDRFIDRHVESGAHATLFLHPNDHPEDSDLVELGEDGFVAAFHPKPHPAGIYLPNMVNAALYVVEKSALLPWQAFSTPSDFGADLFPAMLAQGAKLFGYTSFEYIKDLGTPKRLDKVERHLRAGVVARAALTEPQRCVFLDRDGTLNTQRDYVRRPEDLTLIPGAATAVRRLNDSEHRIAIVTNQPVIARGECTVEGLREIHAKLDAGLAEAGAFVDRIYYCPHHPDRGFSGEITALKIDCDCRKPKAGLIHRAAADLNADLARSWMIGDSTSDLAAASRAGVRSVLVRTGEGGRDGKNRVTPDFTADDIAAAVSFILDVHPLLVETVAPLLVSIEAGDLILVGGQARAGKSTFAATLAHELRRSGRPAEVVGLDRWIRADGERGDGVQGRYDLAAAAAALAPWLAGGALMAPAPFYDRFRRMSHVGDRVAASAGAILIVEGVPALLPFLPTTSRKIWRISVGSDETGRRVRVASDLVARRLASPEAARALVDARVRDEGSVVAAAPADISVDLDACFADHQKTSRSL